MNYSRKQQLRKIIAERKRLLTENQFIDLSEKLFFHLESLPTFQKAKIILLYHSLKDEVRTHSFIEKWKEEKTILLPVVEGENLKLRIHKDSSSLRTGAYGIEEPTGKLFTEYDKIDMAIIPGISFDAHGNRLGRGKGYYDRLLPDIKAYKIGICFAFQVSEDIPTEPHDTKMDLVITENGALNEK
ncbi:5-formyltetrahydrofolate cyclo-ligase [uncultured Bacteroides sp.]|uniref:5-formyltetrahydrofolate cyclo-ligase n=1 Tax=uncultured Bacteroides sp. TaxID=162156 RepID=UPI002AAC3A3F|nr:5-formyltetrahydrofolate cyclo-ligase [uncultured Bacteroides sp.]